MAVRLMHSVWRNTEGSVLLEATVLTPMLLILFLGLYEFSWYFNRQQLVIAGIRDAARYLGASSANPCANSTLVSNAKSIATTGAISGGSVRVPGWITTDVLISCNAINNSGNTYYCPSTPDNCYVVTVQTTFAYPSLGFLGFLGLSVPNISASHTERANNGAPDA
jgi:Flp pilus assembly protein TadG